MKNEARVIAEKIKELVDQLVNMSKDMPDGSKSPKHVKQLNKIKGTSGALSILINEGFFDEPKNIAIITNRLTEIGRYYPQQNISMNLLNLTKRRVLSRIKDTKTKNWQYVLRR
jgi:hypothetical protein